mmetsp:Transcript_1532/g.3157  ORF Transcript_1532/g.3157 Transcript_1532/m.3157 type:complete len:455 (+) Transcript_1532:219-1583(+)
MNHPTLIRLAKAAYLLLTLTLCTATDRRSLYGTNDGTDTSLTGEYYYQEATSSDPSHSPPNEFLSTMMLPMVLVSRVSSKAQSRVVPFALVWVATLIVLRVSIPVIVNKVRGWRDVTISIELDDRSVPSVVKMGLERRSKSNGAGGEGAEGSGSSHRVSFAEVDTSSSSRHRGITGLRDILCEKSRGHSHSDAVSTISGSTSSSSSVCSRSSNSSSDSSVHSDSSIPPLASRRVGNTDTGGRGGVALPDFLKWIDDRPNSSDESAQAGNHHRAQEAFKSRNGRRKRDAAPHLRGGNELRGFDDVAGIAPQRNAWSVLKSVLPAGFSTGRQTQHHRYSSLRASAGAAAATTTELNDYKPVALRPQRWDFGSSDDSSSLELGLCGHRTGNGTNDLCIKSSTGLYSGHVSRSGGRKHTTGGRGGNSLIASILNDDASSCCSKNLRTASEIAKLPLRQ